MPHTHQISSVNLIHELIFSASRSGGPGGQHVNKVNTKVSLRFDVLNSAMLSADQKDTLLKKLSNKITNEGVLVLSAQSSRSQLKNKELVIQKLDRLFFKAFATRKARRPTRATPSGVRKRLEAKKRIGEKKRLRRGL